MPRRLRTHVAALAALALVAPAAPARAQVAETSVTLAWTASGDDSLAGRASRYDLRWSPTPIASLADFARARPATAVPLPGLAGSLEGAWVTGLTPQTTYWFAIRVEDESGNPSALSNVLVATTLASTDVVRPARIALALVSAGTNSVTLAWTDSGDDSLSGTASATEIRWATTPITEAGWAGANPVLGVPAPGPPGTPHQLIVAALDRTRDLWFAARARDDVNRESALSTPLAVPRALDSAPPAAPAGLTARVEATRDVSLRWSANAEPDLAGYHVYRALTAGAPAARLTALPVALTAYLDDATPDSVAVWYAISAVDAVGNEGARTALQQVYLSAAGIAAWEILAPFPNPSRVGDPVTIPLEVPGAGPYDATIEIHDAAGQRVRRLELRGAVPGPNPLTWDGRNDAGRATAPGLYRAWLRVGDSRRLARLVRTP
jgi:chitodextrinase